MKINKIPFNVQLLDTSAQRLRGLRPTTSGDIMDVTGGNFHEDGLFSTLTFGRVGEEAREQKFSFIDIKTPIFHPVVFKALTRLKGLYRDILLGKAYAIWDPKDKDFHPANELTGETGYAFFMSHWKDIKFKETSSAIRAERVKLIQKYQDIATTSKIMVLPAGLRDYEIDSSGRGTQDEINDYYRKLLNISRVIAETDDSKNSPILDNTRRLLQERFNEIYEILEKMITGKKGFIQSKFGGRKIFNGTRNVITAMDTSTNVLGSPRAPRFNNSLIGLYQTIKGCLPVAIYQLRSSFINGAFGSGGSDTGAYLINPKTLKREYVELPMDVRDKWATIDGLEKVINNFENVDTRLKPVTVGGHYLALIYKGPDKTFKVFYDIADLPEGFDPKYVEPINYTELLYLSGYRRWNTLKVVITRYPISDIGSTYTSDVYCKTTIDSEERMELGDDWEPLGGDHIALEFPKTGSDEFFDALSVSSSRLSGLGADKFYGLIGKKVYNKDYLCYFYPSNLITWVDGYV